MPFGLTPRRITVIAIVALVGVFGLVIGSMYMYSYASIQIPVACKDGSRVGTNSSAFGESLHTSFLLTQSKTNITLQFASPSYSIPGGGKGVLLTSNSRFAVAVVIDFNNGQFNSTLYLVDKSDNSTVTRMSFSNDFLVATLSGNVLYLYNSGLGYIINASNGGTVNRIFTLDNYRDVTTTKDGGVNVQTTAIIAGLYGNGGLLYQPDLKFSGIAFGCLVPKP